MRTAPRTALAAPVAHPEPAGRVPVAPGGDSRACKRCAHIQVDHRKEPCATCLRDDTHPGWRKQSAAQRKQAAMEMAREGCGQG